MLLLLHWVHNLDPFLFRFPEGWPLQGVAWYGVAYLLSFLAILVFLKHYRKKTWAFWSKKSEDSLLFYCMIGVLVGGRLGYVFFYDLDNFLKDPVSLIRFWQGGIYGMSSHGGFIGVGIALLFFCKKYKYSPFGISDVLCTIAPIGLLLGRIANFINGELWGKITTVPWAVIFPKSCDPNVAISLIPARHPSQLYEALLEGLFLLLYAQWRFRKGYAKQLCAFCTCKAQGKKIKKHFAPGILTAEFLALYSVLRIFVEIFREPDASLILGLSRGQFYSIGLIIFSLASWVFLKKSQTK